MIFVDFYRSKIFGLINIFLLEVAKDVDERRQNNRPETEQCAILTIGGKTLDTVIRNLTLDGVKFRSQMKAAA